MSFLCFLFSLTIGPTDFDKATFAQLKGEWTIEKVVGHGTEYPAEDWKGKKVVFAEANVKPKVDSVTFHGRLRTKGKMSWLETKTVSTLPKGARQSTPAIAEEYSCSYSIEGKTMRILMIKVQKPNDRGPGAILAGETDRGTLFYLRR